MLWRALRRAVEGPGFYIDAGASDPTALSVTRAFYDRGWRGINIEPLPEQAARLRAARPRDVVVEALLAERAGPSLPFYRVIHSRQTGLSTGDFAEAERHRAAGAAVETIGVAVTTLATVCREHVGGPVHFLKVDVEGAEAAVLAGADFAVVRPWILVVEATQPLDAAAADLGWEAAVLAAGYRHVWFDGLNRFYLAEEHAALEEHFKVPPNVFDNYTVHDGPLQDHLAAVTALVERRGAVMAEMEAEIAELRRVLARATAASEQIVAAPAPTPAAIVQEAAPVPRRSALSRVARGGVLVFYRLFRPFVRPLAWRFRSFMIGPLRQEMLETRSRLDHLAARPATDASAADTALLATMEDVLITLALEAGRGPVSPLVAPGIAPGIAAGMAKALPDRLPKTGAAR